MEPATKKKEESPLAKLRYAEIIFSEHSIQEFVKDIRTCPRQPIQVMERLLRGANRSFCEERDQERFFHFLNGAFEFVTRVTTRKQTKRPLVFVITCYQRFVKRRRGGPRWRDKRAKEKQVVREKFRAAVSER
jgi:hypothetical protein